MACSGCFYSPFGRGRRRYYDTILDKVFTRPLSSNVRVDVHKAWEAFRQQFIDECLNRHTREKWTAVPYLTLADSPCEPGSVIMRKHRHPRDKLSMKPKVAFFAGNTSDFYPSTERKYVDAVPITTRTTPIKGRHYFRLYQSKNTEKAVMITLVLQDRREIHDGLDLERAYIDLDNFEDTGIKHTYCYVVTKVLTAMSIKLEITQDGDIFYEKEFKDAVPVCFQATKVKVFKETAGVLKSIKPLCDIMKFTFRRKRSADSLLSAFTPNESTHAPCSGDYPKILPPPLQPPIRSYRPKIIPRHDRPKNDVVWYFQTEAELRSIMFNFRRDRRLNRMGYFFAGYDYGDNESIDEDIDLVDKEVFNENNPLAYYPAPIVSPIDYEDFAI